MWVKQVINKTVPKIIGLYFNALALISSRRAAMQAMTFLSTPRAGGIRPKDEKALRTAERQGTFTTEYGSIRYYQWNPDSSKTVLLIHGWESNSARWRSLQKMLCKRGWHVVSFDAPAHGASSNRTFDMLQYIAAIDKAVTLFAPQTLIGHSVGGASLCFYLSRYDHPDFEQMVLMGAPTRLRQLFTAFGDAVGSSRRIKSAVDKYFVEKYALQIDDVSAQYLTVDIKIPTLIIHDEKDLAISVKDAEEYHELLINSELFITQGYGHGLQHKQVYNKIVDFLG